MHQPRWNWTLTCSRSRPLPTISHFLHYSPVEVNLQPSAELRSLGKSGLTGCALGLRFVKARGPASEHMA